MRIALCIEPRNELKLHESNRRRYGKDKIFSISHDVGECEILFQEQRRRERRYTVNFGRAKI